MMKVGRADLQDVLSRRIFGRPEMTGVPGDAPLIATIKEECLLDAMGYGDARVARQILVNPRGSRTLRSNDQTGWQVGDVVALPSLPLDALWFYGLWIHSLHAALLRCVVPANPSANPRDVVASTKHSSVRCRMA